MKIVTRCACGATLDTRSLSADLVFAAWDTFLTLHLTCVGAKSFKREPDGGQVTVVRSPIREDENE